MQRLFSIAAIAASIVAGTSIEAESGAAKIESRTTQKSFDLGKLVLKKGANPANLKLVRDPKKFKYAPKKRAFRWRWSQPNLKRTMRRYKRVQPTKRVMPLKKRPMLKARPAPVVVSKSVRSHAVKPHAEDRFRPMKRPELDLKDRMKFAPIAHPLKQNPKALDFKMKKPAELDIGVTIY